LTSLGARIYLYSPSLRPTQRMPSIDLRQFSGSQTCLVYPYIVLASSIVSNLTSEPCLSFGAVNLCKC